MMSKILKSVLLMSLTVTLASCQVPPTVGVEVQEDTQAQVEAQEDSQAQEDTQEDAQTQEEVKRVAPPFAFDNEVYQFAEIPEGEEVAIVTTSHGDIHIRFFAERAPKAVENFITHAKNGYYDGLTFHRVINDFMIQGGDPTGTGAGGESIWGEPFEDEPDMELRHVRGALSMANAGPGTNGSQFFIVQTSSLPDDYREEIEFIIENADEIMSTTDEGEDIYVRDVYPIPFMQKCLEYGGTLYLDGRHTVFGMVYEGMDIVDKIALVEVDGQDKPLEPVIIERIEIIPFLAE